jgi:glycosyltransferase involved in cell wall biosynthesis
VVATGVDGTTEVVVAGETGLLVPPENSKALAEAIRRLAADRPLCSSMGETGRTRVRSLFSSDIMVDAYHRLYLQVLHREN